MLDSTLRVGILGTGRIADKIVNTLKQVNGIQVYAVASRQIERAVWYAKQNGIEACYGSYENLVKDPNIDLVYVATPHSEHYENVMSALENGRNVLCEKAFMLNADQAKDCVILAEKNHCYLAEAMWTRYLPAIPLIKSFISSGIIGQVRCAQGNQASYLMNKKRVTEPELGGGALLDLGVYGINFARIFMGEHERMESCARLENGVDIQDSITFYYPDGKMATLTHGANFIGEQGGFIYGEQGFIVLDNIKNPRYVAAYDKDKNLLGTCPLPPQISGYEYQFMEAKACIEAGFTESPKMPHSEIIAVMEIMDKLRKTWGMKFPQEK